MAIHHCIIADFLNAKNDPAFFDVVAPSASASVRYVVYQPATGNRIATVPFTNQFATSADLFNFGGSPITLPALVSAETLDQTGAPDGISSSAVLRQRKLITFVPQNNQVLATNFLVPVGDLGSTSGGGSGANLLLANAGGQPVSVDYTVNGSPQPNVTLDRGECRAIRINTAPAIVGISSSDNLIVALAIVGKGQDFALTLIGHI
jgi:hypothetical protein